MDEIKKGRGKRWVDSKDNFDYELFIERVVGTSIIILCTSFSITLIVLMFRLCVYMLTSPF